MPHTYDTDDDDRFKSWIMMIFSNVVLRPQNGGLAVDAADVSTVYRAD